jgi:hypothetical protein
MRVMYAGGIFCRYGIWKISAVMEYGIWKIVEKGEIQVWNSMCVGG